MDDLLYKGSLSLHCARSHANGQILVDGWGLSAQLRLLFAPNSLNEPDDLAEKMGSLARGQPEGTPLPDGVEAGDGKVDALVEARLVSCAGVKVFLHVHNGGLSELLPCIPVRREAAELGTVDLIIPYVELLVILLDEAAENKTGTHLGRKKEKSTH